MRIRTVVLVIFLLLVSVFVALNWTELSRVTVLNFGITQAQGPLGLVMLGLLSLASGVFLAYALAITTTSLPQPLRQRGCCDWPTVPTRFIATRSRSSNCAAMPLATAPRKARPGRVSPSPKPML